VEQQAFPEVARASGLSDESRYLTQGNQLVAFCVVGNLVDQLDRKFAERVILYASDLGGERLFDAFSFFSEEEIADHGAIDGKWLHGIDDGKL
jgi:hypothetical protein